VLFNYVSDQSGASTYNAVISLTDLVRSGPIVAPGAAEAPNMGASPSTPDDTTLEPTDPNAVPDPAAAVPVADPAAAAVSDPAAAAASDPAAAAPAASDPAAAAAADPGAQTPPVKHAPLGVDTVYVRYLLAPTVAEQYNITWAGQTLGYSFASDGRMYGSAETHEFACANGECVIPVPAPAIAVVFLSPDALYESTPEPQATQTYATTRAVGTEIIDIAGVQATGNGYFPAGLYSSGSRAEVQLGVGLLALTAAWMLARV
jgi:hypothetical protein